MEHWWFTARLRLRSILRWHRVERELDEELQFHLEHKIEEGIANGLSRAEASYRAMRAMDGMEQRKEEMRDMRRIHWLTDFLDDVRYAIRSLRRTPGLTALVAITLALGIGTPSAVFPLFDGLVLRPYPVPHPGGVLTLVSTSQDNNFGGFSYREYLDIRDKTKSYDGAIANATMEAVGFSAEPGATPRIKGGMMVSGNYFHVLGVEPRLGRGFQEEEDKAPGRDAVVVLGPDVWKQEFASDPSVLGRTIRLNGTEFTVVGVAPETFPGMSIFGHPDFYMPLAMARVFSTNPRKNFLEDRDDRELTVRARLKAGTTLLQARGELATLAKNFEREYPKLNRQRGAAVHTDFEMRTRNDEGPWKMSVTLVILSLAVLLVACTNVAGLLLSRARTRTREIAIRLAIGAGRFRLIRLLLTESLVLAALGGLGGIAVGYGGIQFLRSFRMLSDLPVTVPVLMDMRVLLASLALSALSALLCGLAPALQSTRGNLVNGLKAADVDVPGHKRLWGRNVLLVAQVSTSLMLLMAAFLMVRGFQQTWSGGAGFAKDHLLMARFDPRLVQYNTAQAQQFYKLLAERMRTVSGVESAALTQNIPMGQDSWEGVAFVPDGVQMPRDRENFTATWLSLAYVLAAGGDDGTAAGYLNSAEIFATVLNQTLSFDALADKIYGAAPFALSATASSGLMVSFSAVGQCTAAGATVTLTGAGSCAITASQAGNAVYGAAPTVQQSFTIAKATPMVTWNNPGDIALGVALGAGQLNAAANVNGSFVYAPAAGTVLPEGNGQTLSAQFIPDDGANYNSVTANVVINVVADNGAPDTVITAGPNGTVAVSNADFAWSGSDDITPTASLVSRRPQAMASGSTP
jgi:hypothetical protein